MVIDPPAAYLSSASISESFAFSCIQLCLCKIFTVSDIFHILFQHDYIFLENNSISDEIVHSMYGAIINTILKPSFYNWILSNSTSMLIVIGVSWPSGLVHWTQVLVLSECGFESRPGRSRRLCP